MIENIELEDILTSYPKSTKSYPFGEGTAVYKVNNKMFALVTEGTLPLRLSLKCDPELSQLLRDRYETVMPGYHLNKKHWNTILLTGQLEEGHIKDLIRHSYELVSKDE